MAPSDWSPTILLMESAMVNVLCPSKAHWKFGSQPGDAKRRLLGGVYGTKTSLDGTKVMP